MNTVTKIITLVLVSRQSIENRLKNARQGYYTTLTLTLTLASAANLTLTLRSPERAASL